MSAIRIYNKNGKKLLFSTESEDAEPRQIEINEDQLKSVVENFNNIIHTSVQDGFCDYVEKNLHFKLGEQTKFIFTSFGAMTGNKFKMPTKEQVVDYTNTWKKDVAKSEDEKSKFIVIESDSGDYTLVDSDDNIFVYDHKKQETRDDKTKACTHICNHVMADIVGVHY